MSLVVPPCISCAVNRLGVLIEELIEPGPSRWQQVKGWMHVKGWLR